MTSSIELKPGMTVEVTQQIPQRDDTWTNVIRGKVVRFTQSKTGAWYAHAKDDKLWLDRLTLEAEDGEIIDLSLDPNSVVEVVIKLCLWLL